MVEYYCKRCGYLTKLKGNMKHHLNRKNPCKITLEYVSIENMKNLYGFTKLNELLQIAPNCSKIAPNCSKIAPFCSNVLKKQVNSNQCLHCLKEFSRKSNLRKHIKTCKEKLETEQIALSEMENKIIELQDTICKQSSLINNTTNSRYAFCII